METTQVKTYQPGFADRMQHSKALVAIVAVLGVTVMALAAALVVNRSEAQPGGTTAPVALTAPVTNPAPVTAVTPAPKVALAPRPAYSPTPVNPAPVVARNVCSDCGTVEAVNAVQRQGKVNGVAVGNQTIGLGTVAGGVLGGLVGHQLGNGNGSTAMAVLGAAGGAYAGNKIEANMKKVTVYAVKVRMDNGTTRNVDVSSAVAVGSRVTVEGNNLRMIAANG